MCFLHVNAQVQTDKSGSYRIKYHFFSTKSPDIGVFKNNSSNSVQCDRAPCLHVLQESR